MFLLALVDNSKRSYFSLVVYQSGGHAQLPRLLTALTSMGYDTILLLWYAVMCVVCLNYN